MVILKYVKPSLEISNNIAVIGSSGIIKNKEWGSEINKFSEVVRFNRSPTEGFEKWVGSKTTLRVVNQNVITSSPFPKEDLDNGFWLGQDQNFVKKLRDTKILHYGVGTGKNNIHKSNKLYIFQHLERNAPRKINHIIKGFSSGDLPKDITFSVGIGFITLCIVSGIVPDIYGFDILDRERDHYFEKRREAGPCHNVSLEKLFLKELINKKMVIYHA